MKKKILFSVNTLLVGGIEKALIEILKNESLKKYDVTLLIGYDLGELERLKDQIPDYIKIKYVLDEKCYTKGKKKKVQGTLKKHEKILEESFSWLRKIIFKKRLLKIIEDQDVIIDYDMTLAPYAREIGKNKIAYCHFSLKHYNRGIKSRQMKLGKRLDMYHKIVLVSEDMKKEGEEVFPFLKDKLVTIYNSFNIESIEKKAELVLSEDESRMKEKYILAVGRLEETQKDFTTLIKAYNLIKDKVEEKLYIIGDGRHKDQLESLVRELKLEERVVFLGFQSNPYPWMKRASLFVHSSKFEGLPTVMIEAMILGKVIVATDCPTGPREILEDGKSGVLVEVGNCDELAQGMERVLLSSELKEQYLETSKKSIIRFDGREVIKKLEEIIEGKGYGKDNF